MKKLLLVLLSVFFVGCVPTTPQSSEFKNNPEYRAYIATRLAEAILDNPVVVDDEIEEELCDGSGWITQGDGHKTECPGCDACEGKGQAPEVEWANESEQINDILEELEIKVDPEPEMIIDAETLEEILTDDPVEEKIETIKEIDDAPEKPTVKPEVKKKGPVRKLFNR